MYRRPSATRALRAAVAAIVLAVAAPAGAQIIPDEGDEDVDEDAQGAYLALTLTPAGALPPTVATGALGLGPRTLGFRFHFGQVDQEDQITTRALAGGIDIPFGRATLGLTAGYVDVSCDLSELEDIGLEIDVDCKGAIMGGANLAVPLVGSALGAVPSPDAGSALSVGLDAAVGYGSGELVSISIEDPEFGTFSAEIAARGLSGVVALPIGLVVRSPGLVLVPHLRPGMGYGKATATTEITGQSDAEESRGGVRFMLGGGFGLQFTRQRFGIDVGFQKVFVEDGNMTFGVGATFGR